LEGGGSGAEQVVSSPRTKDARQPERSPLLMNYSANKVNHKRWTFQILRDIFRCQVERSETIGTLPTPTESSLT